MKFDKIKVASPQKNIKTRMIKKLAKSYTLVHQTILIIWKSMEVAKDYLEITQIKSNQPYLKAMSTISNSDFTMNLFSTSFRRNNNLQN